MQLMMMDLMIEVMLVGIKVLSLLLDMIQVCVVEIYGFIGEWKQLGGECEQNFCFMIGEGVVFVVKVVFLSEFMESFCFQMEVLEYIVSVDLGFVVLCLCCMLVGEVMLYIFDDVGESYVFCVLIFVKGVILFD